MHQKQLQLERKEALEKAKTSKFAQYELDVDQEKDLMAKQRFNDPMAKIIKKDKIERKIKVEIKLGKRCKFETPANRFMIKAGHRWDGVDRSNNYERRYLEATAKKQSSLPQ